MKKIACILAVCCAFACNNRFEENEDLVKSNQMVAPEDTSISSYPPGNTPVPPNVQPYSDSTNRDTAAIDSTKRQK